MVIADRRVAAYGIFGGDSVSIFRNPSGTWPAILPDS
jgi:hypothetical protein